MSGVTTNYGLILPADGEAYDVAIQNQNNTQIDGVIKSETTKVQHVEFVRTAQNDNPANTLWGNGAYAALKDAGNSINDTGWYDHPANNQVRFLVPGIYAVTWKGVPNTTVSMWHAIYDGGGAGSVVHARIPSQTVPASDSTFSIAANLHIPAAALGTNSAIITMLASIGVANTAVNWRLKITKLK